MLLNKFNTASFSSDLKPVNNSVAYKLVIGDFRFRLKVVTSTNTVTYCSRSTSIDRVLTVVRGG